MSSARSGWQKIMFVLVNSNYNSLFTLFQQHLHFSTVEKLVNFIEKSKCPYLPLGWDEIPFCIFLFKNVPYI